MYEQRARPPLGSAVIVAFESSSSQSLAPMPPLIAHSSNFNMLGLKIAAYSWDYCALVDCRRNRLNWTDSYICTL